VGGDPGDGSVGQRGVRTCRDGVSGGLADVRGGLIGESSNSAVGSDGLGNVSVGLGNASDRLAGMSVRLDNVSCCLIEASCCLTGVSVRLDSGSCELIERCSGLAGGSCDLAGVGFAGAGVMPLLPFLNAGVVPSGDHGFAGGGGRDHETTMKRACAWSHWRFMGPAIRRIAAPWFRGEGRRGLRESVSFFV
jgi:hypothetical protein